MAAPRTAHLHIGVPKTGTTAIQASCESARDLLRSQGFHYLSGDPNHGERLALAFWDKVDALRLAGLRWKDGAAAVAHRAAVQAALAREIDTAQGDLILSSEHLSEFRPSEVQRMLLFLGKRFERVRVIGYIRDPLDWATSAAQQATQWSGDTLDALFDRPRLPDYAGRFGPWIAALGRSDVELRAFGSNDIVADFSAALGLATPLTQGALLNESVSHRSAILLSHMNTCAPPFIEARHNPFRSFDLVRDARLPGRRFALPRETVETWADALAAERDWAHQALGRAVFPANRMPEGSRATWFEGERDALEAFAETYLGKARLAQNERAARLYLQAGTHTGTPETALKLLDHAWLLTTDRWTLDRIAQLARKHDGWDREKFLAKGRLMRRIEAPEPDDPPLVIGNPFDRPWTRDVDGGSRRTKTPGKPAELSPEPLV